LATENKKMNVTGTPFEAPLSVVRGPANLLFQESFFHAADRGI
jgi:hypothetical protein